MTASVVQRPYGFQGSKYALSGPIPKKKNPLFVLRYKKSTDDWAIQSRIVCQSKTKTKTAQTKTTTKTAQNKQKGKIIILHIKSQQSVCPGMLQNKEQGTIYSLFTAHPN